MSSHQVVDAVHMQNPRLMVNSVLHNSMNAAILDYSGLDSFFDTSGDNMIMTAIKNGAYSELLNSMSRVLRQVVPQVNIF